MKTDYFKESLNDNIIGFVNCSERNSARNVNRAPRLIKKYAEENEYLTDILNKLVFPNAKGYAEDVLGDFETTVTKIGDDDYLSIPYGILFHEGKGYVSSPNTEAMERAIAQIFSLDLHDADDDVKINYNENGKFTVSIVQTINDTKRNIKFINKTGELDSGESYDIAYSLKNNTVSKIKYGDKVYEPSDEVSKIVCDGNIFTIFFEGNLPSFSITAKEKEFANFGEIIAEIIKEFGVSGANVSNVPFLLKVEGDNKVLCYNTESKTFSVKAGEPSNNGIEIKIGDIKKETTEEGTSTSTFEFHRTIEPAPLDTLDIETIEAATINGIKNFRKNDETETLTIDENIYVKPNIVKILTSPPNEIAEENNVINIGNSSCEPLEEDASTNIGFSKIESEGGSYTSVGSFNSISKSSTILGNLNSAKQDSIIVGNHNQAGHNSIVIGNNNNNAAADSIIIGNFSEDSESKNEQQFLVHYNGKDLIKVNDEDAAVAKVSSLTISGEGAPEGETLEDKDLKDVTIENLNLNVKHKTTTKTLEVEGKTTTKTLEVEGETETDTLNVTEGTTTNILNVDDSANFCKNEDGSFKLTIENGNITTSGQISATKYLATSALSKKKDVVPTKHNALEEINKINVVDFFFKTDENNEEPKVGFIADYTDPIFSGPKKDSMDLYNCVGMLLKAVQELSEENKELRKLLEK